MYISFRIGPRISIYMYISSEWAREFQCICIFFSGWARESQNICIFLSEWAWELLCSAHPHRRDYYGYARYENGRIL